MNVVTPIKPEEYHALQLAMQDVLGVVVTEDKCGQVSELLNPVMHQHTIHSYSDLVVRIRESSAGLNTRILEALSTNAGSWSSAVELNRLLNMYVFPNVHASARKPWRIWLVGCGRGQLAYSIAMQIAEYELRHNHTCHIKLLASDVAHADIEFARKAHYPADMLEGLAPAMQKKYLQPDNGGWQVKDKLRQMIEFSSCDLLQPLNARGHCDLIICSDVLIYFSTSVRSQILQQFADLLDPSGVLIVGSGEPVLPFCKRFERVQHDAGVFYRQHSG